MKLEELYLLAKVMNYHEFYEEVNYRMSGLPMTAKSYKKYVLIEVDKYKDEHG